MTIPCPEFEWIEEIDPAVIQVSPEYGAVFQGHLHAQPIRRFHLGWSHATQAEKDDLWDEWVAARGSAFTTSYTPLPRSEMVAVVVRMRDVEARISGAHYEMSATLQQQYTPY